MLQYIKPITNLCFMFENINIWISGLIFLATFWVMITETAHRAVIAFFGAIIMAIVGNSLGFYSYDLVLLSIDFNTILLLLGMMIIVAELEKTGVFQYLAIKTAKKTKGNMWYLIVALGALTSILSMFLDNVTTIVLVVPVTLIMTKLLKINPIPILMAEALLSNIGGVATLIGDPPNILIGSEAGFSFNMFLTHSFPVVLISWISVLFLLRYYYKDELIQPKKGLKSLMKMNEIKCIKDTLVLQRTVITLLCVIFLFFVHEFIELSAASVALLGAATLLLWVSPHKDPKSIFKKVELSVLVFFVSLFILVGGIEHAGVLDTLVNLITQYAEKDILLTALAILWGTAFLSAIIDNIPMTVAMLPVLAMLEAKGIPGVHILWWALVFGVGFGGNASPLGSTTGVIVVGKLESNKTPITTRQWIKVGLPATFISLIIASIALILFQDFFKY
ncbi:MAG: ArsB/NhaD family transporter [Candidatus Gracilibacteria bacterium]|nr:ArsB/NhaD family transporter [Candidatus Gracilibacteria bacterium]